MCQGLTCYYMHTATEYSNIGDPLLMCQYCEALMWCQERMHKNRHTPNPKFPLCCGDEKVQLPFLKTPPPALQHLLFDNKSNDSKNFQHHIQTYNMMFALTSPRVKLHRSINNDRGPPNVRIQGKACHRIGSWLSMKVQISWFAQLYIYDTKNEIQNRIQASRG